MNKILCREPNKEAEPNFSEPFLWVKLAILNFKKKVGWTHSKFF